MAYTNWKTGTEGTAAHYDIFEKLSSLFGGKPVNEDTLDKAVRTKRSRVEVIKIPKKKYSGLSVEDKKKIAIMKLKNG